MRYREVGGLRLSVVGLGTWQFGSSDWAYGEGYAARVAPDLVRRALELGVNVFDTAEAYAWGRSERILGAALAGRRNEAFVATKLFPVLPVSPIVERRARASAGRLCMDRIDLYQVHWPNPVVPVERTMAAFSHLFEEGLVGHAGVSNFSLARWQRAEAALGAPVLTNQVRFNLLDRRPERELVPWARSHDRLVIAYSPLAQGVLSGRYRAAEPPRGVRARAPAFLAENLRRASPLLDTLEQLGRRHACTSAQVALAWLLRRPNVIVIPGASSIEQLEANVAAADVELSDAEDTALGEAADAFEPLAGRELASAMASVRLQRIEARVRTVSAALRA